MQEKLSLGPYFTHDNETRSPAPEINPLGVRLEWATASQSVALPLFAYQPATAMKKLQTDNAQGTPLHRVLCPAERIPCDVQCAEADTVDTPAGAMLPVEAVLCALHSQGRTQRSVFEVLRELSANVRLCGGDVLHPTPSPEGMLRQDIEGAGFRLTTALADEETDEILTDIGWHPTIESPALHAAVITYPYDAESHPRWLSPPTPGVAQLLTTELQRLAPNPQDIFTAKGHAYLQAQVPVGTGKACQTQKHGCPEEPGECKSM